MSVSVVLVKKFTYRGDASEEFSNRYFLTGADPATNADWLALVNALKIAECECYNGGVTVIRAYGYTSDALDANSVYVRDMVAAGETQPGQLAATGGIPVSGDVAATVRWKTSRMNGNGKSIYLRKYFHGVYASSTVADQASGLTIAQLGSFANKLWSGPFLDNRTVRARGQSSETIVGHQAQLYLTTRTLKRRGKRPTPGP